MKDSKQRLPKVVIFPKYWPKDTAGEFHPAAPKTIRIHPTYDKALKKIRKSGFLAGSTTHHEAAHLLHMARPGAKRFFAKGANIKLRPAEKEIAGRVSTYAKVSVIDFVAEVYAGILAGNTYDSEVMSLYKNYYGPRVKNG